MCRTSRSVFTQGNSVVLVIALNYAREHGQAFNVEIHILYGEKIASKRAENEFAYFEGQDSNLKIFGERIWTEESEYATFNLFYKE